MHATKRRDLAIFIFVIGFANFFAFMVVSQYLGGSAANGFVRAGHYYLGEHGKYTEVSYRLFRYSQIHGCTLFITHPLALISLAYAGSIKKEAENYPFPPDDG
ncbi:MAG: hypothetical protein ABR514_09610 [Chthoniobacterales bacterium]